MCTPALPHGAPSIAPTEQVGSARRPPLLLTVGSDPGASAALALSSTTDVECGSTGGTPRTARSGQPTFSSQQVPAVTARVITAQEVADTLRRSPASSPTKVIRQSSHPVLLSDPQSGAVTRRTTGERLRLYTEEYVHPGGQSYPRVVAIGQRSIEKLYDTVDWEDPPPGMLSPRSSEGPSRHCSCTSLSGSGNGFRPGRTPREVIHGCGARGASRERLVAELAARVLEDIEARQARQVAHLEAMPSGVPHAMTSWCRSGAATVPAPTSIARVHPYPPERRVVHRPAHMALTHPTASVVAAPPGVGVHAPFTTSALQVQRVGSQIGTTPCLPGTTLLTQLSAYPQSCPSSSQVVDVAPAVFQAASLPSQEVQELEQQNLGVSSHVPPHCEDPCTSTPAELSTEMLSEEASSEREKLLEELRRLEMEVSRENLDSQASDDISTAAPTLSATSQPLTSTTVATTISTTPTTAGNEHKRTPCARQYAVPASSSSKRNGGTGAAPTRSAAATPREAALELGAELSPGEDLGELASSGDTTMLSHSTPTFSAQALVSAASVQTRRTRRAMTLAERWVSTHAAHPVGVTHVTYPCGVSVDLSQLSDGFGCADSPGGSEATAPGTPADLRHAQIAWAIENGSFAESAFQAYEVLDTDMKGFLPWGDGAIQEFVAAVFRLNELSAPSDAQVYRAYMLFTNGGALGDHLDARECLSLVDALVRSALWRELGSRDPIAVSSSHASTPLVPGTAVNMIADGVHQPFAGNFEAIPRDSPPDNVHTNDMLPTDVQRWAPEDVGRWAVEELGLPEELGELLVHEEIHGPVLLSLEEEDLERLNVAPFGRRRQLILGIRELIRQQLDTQSCDHELLPMVPHRSVGGDFKWFSAPPHDASMFAERCHGRARANASPLEAEVRTVVTPSMPSSSSPGFATKHLRPGPGRGVGSPVSREVSGILQSSPKPQQLVRVLPPRKIDQPASARFVSSPNVRQASWQHSAASIPSPAGGLLSLQSMSPRARTPSPPPMHQAFSPGFPNQQSKRNAKAAAEMQSPRMIAPVLKASPAGQPIEIIASPSHGMPSVTVGSTCIPTCPSSRTASPPVPPPPRGASMNIPVYTATRTQKGDTVVTTMPVSSTVAATMPASISAATTTRVTTRTASSRWLSPRK